MVLLAVSTVNTDSTVTNTSNSEEFQFQNMLLVDTLKHVNMFFAVERQNKSYPG